MKPEHLEVIRRLRASFDEIYSQCQDYHGTIRHNPAGHGSDHQGCADPSPRMGGHIMPLKDRALKRLQKKAKKGMRGWPAATVAFYGPNASRATKVVVGIVPSEHKEVGELRDWKIAKGDVRNDTEIAVEMLAFMESQGVLSVVMTDGIIGCPHRTGR
jgi:hypothetical protein